MNPYLHRPEIVTITPARAIEYLKANRGNRNLREAYVADLAQAMKDGAWRYNGTPIVFADNGDLIDGQHRLSAVVVSGIEQPMVVQRGVARSAQSTIDTGRRRNFADHLRINYDVKNVTLLAAATGMLWRYERYGWAGLERKDAVPFSVLGEFFESRPMIVDYVNLISGRYARKVHLPPSNLVVSKWVLDEIHVADSLHFFERLLDGVDLEVDDPIRRLREILRSNKLDKKKLSSYQLQATLLKAWNLYREGKQVKLLFWKSGGANPEPFPEPR